MKKKLLFLAIILLTTLKGFSQAEAYSAPDINQCGNEVFDLTVQTPIILGNQNPEEFTVTYYTSQADAASGTNPIANPTAFVSPQQQLIFARVDNDFNDDSAITVFHISWGSGVFIPNLPDVSACEAYTLPTIEVGHYYLSEGGIDLLPFGTVITATTTIYVYAENDNGCSGESSFLVVINSAPATSQPTPLYACDENGDGAAEFDLTAIIPQIAPNPDFTVVTFHETELAAQNGFNAIPNPENYVNINPQQVLYARGQSTTSDCHWVVAFHIFVTECNDNSVSGFVSLNLDGNCETFEAAAAGIPVYYTHNNDVYIAYTNLDGYYSFNNIPDGAGTVYIPGGALSTVSPENYTVTMPGNDEDFNFCITPGAIINDVAVTFIAIGQARSGFTASYVLIYQNLGTTTQSGDITLVFDDYNLDFLSAIPSMVQSGNTLTLSYTNLMPFETRVAIVSFTVMVPQITPAGTILNFNATITPLTGDVNTSNNVSLMSQVVVNSYDPNDIAVREGEVITDEQTNDYLNYTVRFQNKGTANAENVRVVVDLDENLDWSTFEALSGSDAFTVKRTGNEVEFMFTGIDLPYENDDEPGSHGHIIYRIKPKADVTIGDSMSAQADIYFDFNDPVITNIVTTTVENTAGIKENDINAFTVYPNPASGNVNLILANTNANRFDVSITDVLGKVVIENTFNGTEANLNIGTLKSGVYFINITAEGKQSTKKLIVK